MHDMVRRVQPPAVPALTVALQQAFQSWNGLFDWLPVGIYCCDRDGVLTQYNRRASELWGWSPPAGDKSFRSWHAYRSADGHPLPSEQAPMNEVLLGGQPVHDREVTLERPDGTHLVVLVNADPVLDADGDLIGGVSCFQDITERVTERKQAEARQTLLMAELNHRVKNTLAIIQAIASQTLQNADSLDDFRTNFQARVMALSHAHDLLTNSNWEGACLGDILSDAMMPFQGEALARCTIEGDKAVRIGPQSAVILAVAFHELATNAAKYGALSNDAGRVSIAWRERKSAAGAKLQVRWKETGGPPVRTPTQTGFGLKLIEKALAKQFDSVRLDFVPEGLAYSFEIKRANGVFG